MLIIGLIGTLVLFVIGIPIWVALSTGAIFLLLLSIGSTTINIPTTFFGGIDSFTLTAVTFFLLAGNIMASCGPSEYIYNFVNSIFGKKRAGLPITAVVVSMVYAAITGSSAATLAGVAELSVPEMRKAGYSNRFCAGLLAASSTLGQMIPPSIYMIVYGSLVQRDVGELFISGIVPGILLGLLLIVVSYRNSPKGITVKISDHMQTSEYKKKAFLMSIPALLMPVAVLGGIYSGFVTPTEAAALGVAYAFLISGLIYRTLDWGKFKQSLFNTVNTNAMIFILVASAMLFANPITYAKIPQNVSAWILSLGLSKTMLIFVVSLLFLVLGCFMDSLPILYLTVPIVYPALIASGVDLLHFNVVLILCMQIGQITPPFGLSIYIASGVCNAPVDEVTREVVPYLISYIVALVIFILIPKISTFLPYALK